MKKALLLFVFITMLLPGLAVAQGCSVCTNTAASLDDKSAKGLNGGIIYLATFPLAILGTIGFVWWRHNRPDNAVKTN
jgi:hypothetical protein